MGCFYDIWTEIRGRSVSFTNISVYFELLITITAVDSEILLQIYTSRVYLSVARVPHKNEELSNALSKIKQNSFLSETRKKSHGSAKPFKDGAKSDITYNRAPFLLLHPL